MATKTEMMSCFFQIVFEAQRGNDVGGEIGLDNVVLTSGPCLEHGDPNY